MITTTTTTTMNPCNGKRARSARRRPPAAFRTRKYLTLLILVATGMTGCVLAPDADRHARDFEDRGDRAMDEVRRMIIAESLPDRVASLEKKCLGLNTAAYDYEVAGYFVRPGDDPVRDARLPVKLKEARTGVEQCRRELDEARRRDRRARPSGPAAAAPPGAGPGAPRPDFDDLPHAATDR
jgi:hypothetical protein